jgi:2-polyprenyl-6-methoxyphenol hydroxylase-like FAD-dependent oxidoreductase
MRRAVIIGGSMSGLFAAAFLRRKGWDADVYERSTVELVGRGAGITTHPELLEALSKCGAGTRELGVEVEKRIALDREGRYHLGHNFERVDQDGSGVVAHFAGGRSERADILIGADGIRSSVRAQVAPDTKPIYAGYYIWRAAPNEADLRPETRESIFPRYLIFVGPRQLREMCVDENGHQHDYSVPPPLIRKELIARMRADAEQTLPPQVLDCLNCTRPFFTPIYDFATPQFVFGRVVLVGDAASSARPHMGFGMAKAGGDAQALVEALESHDDLDAGLAAYDRDRQPLSEQIVLHGRKLGAQLGVNVRTDEDRAMEKLLQDPRAMLDWIAVPHFLERA